MWGGGGEHNKFDAVSRDGGRKVLNPCFSYLFAPPPIPVINDRSFNKRDDVQWNTIDVTCIYKE